MLLGERASDGLHLGGEPVVLHSLDMSFDLIVLDSLQPLDAGTAAEVYERTVDGEAEE